MSQPRTPLHLPGADGNVVETPLLAGLRGAVTQMAPLGGVVGVDGPAGTGKTFSVDEATGSLEMPVWAVATSDRPRGKQTITAIYEAILGTRPPTRTSSYELQDDVRQLLSDTACGLVVDEAQNLDRESLRMIRWLHDHRATSFFLVLVGCGIRRHIARLTPELDSRVGRWLTSGQIPGPQLRPLLDQYHPIFARTDEKVLLTLYEAVGGNFRMWASILETALSNGIGTEGISAKDARFILHLKGAGSKSSRRRAA